MKPYTCSVEIDLARDRVIELFDNPDNLYKWQPGLQSFEHVSGERGQPGATSKIVYLNGKHRIEMTEVVTARELPERFDGYYEWGGGRNTLENRFIEVGPERTRWESTCSYELRSFMIKVMGFLMPGMFRKQNQKWMDHFKAFCEHGTDVRETAAR